MQACARLVLAADSRLARCNGHRAATKSATNTNLHILAGTPLDTADAMVNSLGHVGVFFAESGTGLCETDVRRFQRSFRLPAPDAARDAGLKCRVAPGSFEVPGFCIPVVLICRDAANQYRQRLYQRQIPTICLLYTSPSPRD